MNTFRVSCGLTSVKRDTIPKPIIDSKNKGRNIFDKIVDIFIRSNFSITSNDTKGVAHNPSVTILLT
jgi:hypothetical protein